MLMILWNWVIKHNINICKYVEIGESMNFYVLDI